MVSNSSTGRDPHLSVQLQPELPRASEHISAWKGSRGWPTLASSRRNRGLVMAATPR
jgi:hypothetical protein